MSSFSLFIGINGVFVHEGGGGRIILSDGGGIRRNVIVVQKPSAGTVDKLSSMTAVSSVTPESSVTPVDSVVPHSSVTPVTVGVAVSVSSLSPPKVRNAFEQVRHSVTMQLCWQQLL